MKTSLIVSICFFVILQTQDLYASYLPVPFPFLLPLLFGGFLFVLGAFVNHFYCSIREKFVSKKRTIYLLITAFILGITIYRPAGIIQYEMFTAEDILVAEMGSDANCTTTLRLKKDATFNETSFCFGLNRITGYYQKRNDTIWFNSTNKYYQFGIIGPTAFDSTNVYINLYKNRNDTLPYFLKLAK